MLFTEKTKLSELNIPNLEVFLEDICLVPPKKTNLYDTFYEGNVSIKELCEVGQMDFVLFKSLVASYCQLATNIVFSRKSFENSLSSTWKDKFSLIFLETSDDLSSYLQLKSTPQFVRKEILFFEELDWQVFFTQCKLEQRKLYLFSTNFKRSFSAALYLRKQGLSKSFALQL